MRVGLLGGSFDPPHAAHVAISKAALKRFRLDRVVWLVSPGNPLKENPPAALERRIAAARALIDDPRIGVSDIEARIGTRYTAETLARLQKRWPAVRFTWLMGADNLAQFHRWQDWKHIADSVPIGVLARPGQRIAARLGPAARVLRAHRLSSRASILLGQAEAPAWCFVNLPMSEASSTAIRQAGLWTGSTSDGAPVAEQQRQT
ncbi:nicotinate-nucleotide adenylyltransferase [Cognatishimia sp. F0-27]|uniref:nicotinate-nucleotide adenylyltransferase n=1 Tax=Cognatishimia sp. F0-27 TaxID=2816855 RepID=UPI001D0C7CCB|nr:nicotinate-nucleotide adenylyltransferase [Cognatishimia sp. F0-27]MCC1492820.1 nicotinate-nucleotide adenylyltransferase [Cognatishimia sp. F0-27]